MATRETVEEELARRWAEMITTYLERIPLKERRLRLRLFRRAIEQVEARWALLSF